MMFIPWLIILLLQLTAFKIRPAIIFWLVTVLLLAFWLSIWLLNVVLGIGEISTEIKSHDEDPTLPYILYSGAAINLIVAIVKARYKGIDTYIPLGRYIVNNAVWYILFAVIVIVYIAIMAR